MGGGGATKRLSLDCASCTSEYRAAREVLVVSWMSIVLLRSLRGYCQLAAERSYASKSVPRFHTLNKSLPLPRFDKQDRNDKKQDVETCDC